MTLVVHYGSDGTTVGVVGSVRERLAVPWGGLEEAWLLLGIRGDRCLTATHAIQAGHRSERSPSSISFDRDDMLTKVIALRAKLGVAIEPVGIAHTHPPPDACPSPDDLRADLEWVKDSTEPFVFCISCAGRLSWWLLRAGWKDYEELK